MDAIATRQYSLTPKQRSMLILVDGKRGLDELARLSPGETEQLLDQLVDQGLIEASGAAPEARPSRPAPLAPAAASAASLAHARRFAVRRLTDILGPSAQTLCLRIESARNAQDYQAAVARAQSMVREVRGEHAAGEFAAALEANRPG